MFFQRMVDSDFYVSVIEKASETMKGVEGEPLGLRLTGS